MTRNEIKHYCHPKTEEQLLKVIFGKCVPRFWGGVVLRRTGKIIFVKVGTLLQICWYNSLLLHHVSSFLVGVSVSACL
jgi:hypothetical protein